ncbi:unnamed protein product [Caenorhabditis auriculariae]|uniref:Mos1 transposase HTH domain-containing protein n=1 Tax=Caenorhabditis auriculariae TaxID=2777116 RepID=A0A8S1GW98_9PELO|nr:unnamed protein product [Caenorhabditis auriculariae]
MDQGRIRTFVYYEWLLGKGTGTTIANICRACKEDAVSQRTVRRWFNRFESGDTSLEDREPNGRHCTVDDDEVRRCIKEKPEATTRELATTLGCSKSTIHNRLNLLGYPKVLAGPWDPHRLMDANKHSRVAVVLVTEDETRVLYDNVAHHAVWIPREEEPPTTPKSDLLPLKIVLCYWTVTASIYSDQLEKLAVAIRKNRPRRASVHLQHENARPHVGKKTQQKLATLGWETVAYPPYSTDLAPSDFHLFRPLEHRLAGKKIHQLRQTKIRLRVLLRSPVPGVPSEGHRRPAQSMG